MSSQEREGGDEGVGWQRNRQRSRLGSDDIHLGEMGKDNKYHNDVEVAEGDNHRLCHYSVFVDKNINKNSC